MKKIIALILLAVLLTTTVLLSGCGESKLTIAVPNDTTNEARALLLLQREGFIKLKEGAGITATIRDIVENPLNIEFKEVAAEAIPNLLADVDYAIINSNFAISAGINPVEKSLVMEDSSSAYANLVAVKEGHQNDPIVLALMAALKSQKVADFIQKTYGGAVVSVIANPTDGYDASIDYDALNGQTLSIAASPTPHAEILKLAAEILKEKGITLEIREFDDYVLPNNVVEEGELNANFFQHQPYLDDFNAQNGTHLVSVGVVHVEPMGLYGGKQSDLSALKK